MIKNACALLFLLILLLSSCAENDSSKQVALTDQTEITIPKQLLFDKIKGAWAGQVIGCTYGGPTEFRFNGTMIPDDHFIPWYDGVISWWYENAPGLYDDIYMDLTFVDVFEKEGLDAPIESFAYAFANADYWLWHANQAARYNILNGIMPPESGHWKNNPHSEDIDFQIEADFAGIMAPGMANTATKISDDIGHIMNFGDGWYGGVYVAAMYALAYVSDNIPYIVSEGLKSVPEESSFYQIISDVIQWHKEHPDNWKMNWFLVQQKWASEVGCPDGVYEDFNIDAKINAAYIVIGLLYGNGDFGQSTIISTLCGQDSDCNPASVAGILGTVLGYEKIPEKWKADLKEVEDMNFKYTDISLNKAYQYSLSHALQVIENNGGKVSQDQVTIKFQKPEPVRFEQGFPNHHPAEFKDINYNFNEKNHELSFRFNGNGFVLRGGCTWETDDDYIGKIQVYIDDNLYEEALLPADYRKRRHDITWAYDLAPGDHNVTVKLLNPAPGAEINANRILVYSAQKEYRTKPGIIVLN